MTSPRPFSLCLCSIESWGWIFVLGHTLARGTNFFLNSSINLLIFRANSCECYVLFPQKWNCLFPVLAADWREMAAWETYFRWSLFNEGTRAAPWFCQNLPACLTNCCCWRPMELILQGNFDILAAPRHWTSMSSFYLG